MTELASNQQLEPIREEVSTRAVEALMSNYRDAQSALLELVDNAIDNRGDDPLLVRIRITREEISVSNSGGRGLDLDGLRKFFVWGYSEKTEREIGFYGVGGKAAMGYLGRSMEVVCSPQGSNDEYRVFDPSWETRTDGSWKTYNPERRTAATQDGYFRVKVGDIKKAPDASAMHSKLADIYRPLLLDGSVVMQINGRKIEAMSIAYKQDDPTLKPESFRVKTRLGEEATLKVGVLGDGQRIRPGIRCYYRGRLIDDGQFFDHPTPAQLPQASKLIGEVFLDFVPITANKSTFDRDSVQWKDASLQLNKALKPWIEKISKMKMDKTTNVENYEQEMVKRAKRLLEHVFASSYLVTKSMLPGSSTGRREGNPREDKPSTGRTLRAGQRTGATAPDITATVGLETVKRWGALNSWEVVSMGTDEIRSDVVDEGGRKVLKINSDYSLYQAEKKSGAEALELYMGETAILRIAQEVCRERSLEEFLDLSNKLISDWGSIYQIRIPESASKSRKRSRS